MNFERSFMIIFQLPNLSKSKLLSNRVRIFINDKKAQSL